MTLVFDWDENKSLANFAKHRVRFEEAKTIFGDPLQLTYPEGLHRDVFLTAAAVGGTYRGRRSRRDSAYSNYQLSQSDFGGEKNL